MSAVLEAKKRASFQRSGLTQIREAGNFPAIVYGKGVDSESVYVNEGEFFKIMKEVGRNGVIALKMDGQKYNVILQDYHQDPLKNGIVHADFLAVDLSSNITANVRIDIEGEAIGVKEGGVLQQPLFELSATAKVSQFPEYITVDASQLGIGDTLTIGDIRSQYDFEINHEDDETIVSVLAPRSGEEAEMADEQAEE
ncbi:50S ribosomal protein L25/general stress protein Ctc [Bacillus sp. REN10]|uniref:50S ribosomal protein L25/general stress protein Ctc n=1 Tax=Bacillus sp. REN10 TaxID=2782541 RepID=UPI00193B2AAF|nr:50S ribosomal protein L25/general stress protein Ctc [Bacillus sp. REN10]